MWTDAPLHSTTLVQSNQTNTSANSLELFHLPTPILQEVRQIYLLLSEQVVSYCHLVSFTTGWSRQLNLSEEKILPYCNKHAPFQISLTDLSVYTFSFGLRF